MRIAYVLGTYPKLSETFILREIEELERQGFDIRCFSVEKPGGPDAVANVDRVNTTVYAPRLLSLEYAKANRPKGSPHAEKTPVAGLLNQLKLEHHIRLSNYFASCMEDAKIERVHAHFAGVPCLVGMRAAEQLGVPFSFSAHANDVYTGSRLLEAKSAAANFIVTCNEACRSHLLAELSPGLHDRVHLVHHGIRIDEYVFHTAGVRNRPARLLSVGRLEEKKGFEDLLIAVRQLKEEFPDMAADIIGDGSQARSLRQFAQEEGLEETVTFHGALPHDSVKDYFGTADVFGLASKRTAGGDQDGIPNVLIEAGACGTPIAATRAGGIPEIVQDGQTGLLSPPGDPAALANNLKILLEDTSKANRLSRAARAVVEESFNLTDNVRKLVALFESQAANQ